MKAIVRDRFGPPDVLRLADLEVPSPGAGEVVMRVRAASINPYDWHMLRGDPYVARLMMGMGKLRPKTAHLGIDAAGEIEAVGPGVHDLAPGDEVLGFCPGSFAEYARGPASRLVRKPAGLSFEEAAALPMAGSTALRAIRDVGEVKAGQRVLINGAGGGIGTFAVQIAAAMGAEVTGVCSTRNVDLVRSLGAAEVSDYTKQPFPEGPFDLILDNVGNLPLRRLRRSLTPAGTLAANAGGSPGRMIGAVGPMLWAGLAGRFVRHRIRFVPTVMNQENLLALARLTTEGKLTPVVDRTYSLPDVPAGVRYVEQGHARAKAVVTIP